jgi:hypothetical protein
VAQAFFGGVQSGGYLWLVGYGCWVLANDVEAGVSGGKEAWMLREVDAGLVGWLGSVGVARRFQSGGSFCGGVWGDFGIARAEHTLPTAGQP